MPAGRGRVDVRARPDSWNGWNGRRQGPQGRARRRDPPAPAGRSIDRRAPAAGSGTAAPADDSHRTDRAIRLSWISRSMRPRRGAFDWCVFTSANAVEVFANRMDALDVQSESARGRARRGGRSRDGRRRCRRRAQSDALCRRPRPPMPLPRRSARQCATGARVLYPRSAIGRDVLPNELRAAGFDVSWRSTPIGRCPSRTSTSGCWTGCGGARST